MRKIIIINGQGGAGKDTFTEFCATHICQPIYSFSSITIYKEIAKMLGWDGTKDEKSRQFLSDLKYLSSEYNNYPNKYLLYSINRAPENSICFLHIREPEEIEDCIKMIQEKNIKCEIHTLLLIRDNIPKKFDNVSDDFVFDYEYDQIIHNDGDLEDLMEKSRKYIINITL